MMDWHVWFVFVGCSMIGGAITLGAYCLGRVHERDIWRR